MPTPTPEKNPPTAERQLRCYPSIEEREAIKQLADQESRSMSNMLMTLVREALRVRGVTVP